MAEKNSLWKNIRNKAKRNRESGATPKKPTTEMLRQERKIKASKADGGPVKENPLYKSNEDYVYNQWRESMPENLREESTGYNLRGAWEGGLEPEYVTDDMGFHLGSRNPNTGEILKSPEHHTYDMAIEGDIRAGYTPRVDARTGKMYSTNYSDPTIEGPFKGYDKGGPVGEDESDIPYRPLSMPMEGYEWEGRPENHVKEPVRKTTYNKPKPKEQVKSNTVSNNNTSVQSPMLPKYLPKDLTGQELEDYLYRKAFERKETSYNPGGISTSDLLQDIGEDFFDPKRVNSVGENLLEIIDPTGISSWDDASTSYNSKNPTSFESIANYGSVIPVLGKIPKAAKLILRGWNAINGAWDVTKDNFAEGGYFPTQSPGEALFKGYAEGGYMYPDGGKTGKPKAKNKPIYTSNPNDPRIQMYNDSLNLYNKGELLKLNSANLARNLTNEYNQNRHFWNPPARFSSSRQPYLSEGYSTDIENRNDYSQSVINQHNNHTNNNLYSFFDNHSNIKPTHSYINSTNIDANSNVGGHFTINTPGYKKPVQPVEYKTKTTDEKPLSNSKNRWLMTDKDWKDINTNDYGTEEAKVRGADTSKYDIYRLPNNKFQLVPKVQKQTQPIINKKIDRTPVQVDRLEPIKLTSIPIEEKPLELNLKTPPKPKPERQTVMLHQRNIQNQGVSPENNPNFNYSAGQEYNMGDKTGWHDIPQGPYISNGVTHNSYVDYLKANPDLYDVQGGFAQGGYSNPYQQYAQGGYVNQYSTGSFVNADGKPKPKYLSIEELGGRQVMESDNTRVAPVVNHVKEAQYRAQAAKDVKNPKITDDDFRDKHGYNKHVYQMNNDAKYKAEVEANAKELVKKNGSIDLPSTYMDSKSFTGNPNLNYMIPNGLTGEARKAYEQSQMDVVGAALPIPGLQQMGRIPSIGTSIKNVANIPIIKSAINSADEFIGVPIQFRKEIKELKKLKENYPKIFNTEEGKRRLGLLGIDPNKMSDYNLTFKPNLGSSYFTDGYNNLNNINIDFRQLQQLKKKGHLLNHKSMFEHELGHLLQKEAYQQKGRIKDLDQFNIDTKKYLEDLAKHREFEERINNNPFLADWEKTFKILSDRPIKPTYPIITAKPTTHDKTLNGILGDSDKISEEKLIEAFQTEHGDPSKLPFPEESFAYFNYFNDLERFPHAREMRENMISTGAIKNMYDPITADQVTKFIADNPKDRISSFIHESPTNINKLKYTLNNMPSTAPVIGAGSAGALYQLQKNNQPQQQATGGYTMKNNNKSWREYLKYAQGGYTNPYNQYQDDPYNQYKVGGKVWQDIGSGAYGVLSGTLNTITGGLTTGIMDMGEDALQKAANKNFDPNNPEDVKAMREIESVGGAGEIAGSWLGLTVNPANVGSAVAGTGKGANDIVQASTASDDAKQWSKGISGVMQMGHSMNGMGSASSAGTAPGGSAPGAGAGAGTGTGTGLGAGAESAASSVTSGATTGAGAVGEGSSSFADTMTNFSGSKFGKGAKQAMPYVNQAASMVSGNKGSLLEQGVAAQDYLNSPEYLALKKQGDITVNNGINFSQGGNITNNSLNLRNTMRNKRFAKGGTFDQFGINFIPESAGLHHESANGGVPIGPNALAEGGEAKLQMADGSQYIVSGEVDGANTQSINGETMTQRLKKKLKPFMMGGLASNPKDKENVRRPFDSYSKEAIDQAANAAVQETEAVKMQRGGALQYAANGGKLNKDIEKIVMEEYTAAYGGMLPNKYKGKVNMPNSYAKGGIHIKESKKGTFTAAATKHGKSVQEFAQQVLANKENYSPGMVKKANFARNASKWNHADGGYVHNQMIQPMLAEGGPIYGDPASEYVYAMGGMYGNPYARGGQIDYTNDMYSSYAGGGPMVSNVNQPFNGPAAQNRGGMYMTYADGGMMPPEQQMMQEQQMQEQQAPQEQMQQQGGGQEQMMQMVQQIAQAIMQGANPEQLMAKLANSGMPQEQVQQIMQAAMQMAAQQQQQQPMQQGQQMMPPQGMMARGGRMYYEGGPDGPPYDLPGMADMSSSEYNSINSYLTNLNTPNFVDNQGNTSSILSRMSNKKPLNLTGWNTPNQSIQGPYDPNRPEPITTLDRLKQNYFDTSNSYNPNPSLPNNQLGTSLNLTGWKTPSSSIEGPWQPGISRPPLKGFNAADAPPGDETTMPDGTIFDGNNYNTQTPLEHYYSNQDVLTGFGNKYSGNTNNINNVNTDTPWSEEPWYSKAARRGSVIPGIAATVTGMLNKKRRLDPSLMAAQKVDYTTERINDARQSRLKYNKYADTVRNMGNRGYGNLKDALLNYNVDLAGRNAESVMREENTNAQLAQQADMTNTASKNQFKQINEGMFQNAQTQALAGLGDTFGDKLPNISKEERKQYLQEWIAKNRLGTRSYRTNINGQDVFVNNLGQVYDAKTGVLLSEGQV